MVKRSPTKIIMVRKMRLHHAQRGVAACLFAFVFRATRFGQPEVQARCSARWRCTARGCTARRTAIAALARAATDRRAAARVPLARKFRIAFDSARWRPSGNSSSGIRPLGLRARNCRRSRFTLHDVDVLPLVRHVEVVQQQLDLVAVAGIHVAVDAQQRLCVDSSFAFFTRTQRDDVVGGRRRRVPRATPFPT